jgi:unsaturated chondroitin disaccharide hydrolase
MRKTLLLLTVVFFSFTTVMAQSSEIQFIKENIDFAVCQTGNMLKARPKGNNIMPHSLKKDGNPACGSIYLWTAGFFPGTLWYLHDFTKNPELKDSARVWTEMMETVKTFTDNHDIGFMMYCSYGNAYRITRNESYKNVLIESARSLSTRFSQTTGTIKSWDGFRSWHGEPVYKFPVIIDNMMNLELLFFASRVTGDGSFKKIAVAHAEKTMQNQIRKDGSCYHVMFYDPETGKPIKGETAQGYADNSTWSRGQGWGIYGFTVVYRETKDARFLQTAQKMADYYVDNKNLPSDKVAWWDFNAFQPGFTPGKRSNASNVVTNYRDASAAALVASGLLELSTYTKGIKGQKYFETAKQILHSLASPAYRAKEGTNGNFILMHSVGAIPHNSEIDLPLVYADYYFVEALARYNALIENKPLPIF